MTDTHLRELERRFQATGSVDDETYDRFGFGFIGAPGFRLPW